MDFDVLEKTKKFGRFMDNLAQLLHYDQRLAVRVEHNCHREGKHQPRNNEVIPKPESIIFYLF